MSFNCIKEKTVKFSSLEYLKNLQTIEEKENLLKISSPRFYIRSCENTNTYRVRVGCCLVKDNFILLVKNKFSGKWGIPKGRYEKKIDKNIFKGMKREMYEETGIDFLDFSETDLIVQIIYGFFVFFKNYNYELDSFKLDPKDKDEISDIKWVNIKEINKRKLNLYSKNVINYCLEMFFNYNICKNHEE